MRILNVFLLFFSCTICIAQAPPRKAIIGLQVKAVSEGLRIDSVVPYSTADALRLKKGDVLLTINNNKIATDEQYRSAVLPLRSGESITVTYSRSGKVLKGNTSAVMRPYELSDYADVAYHWVKFRNGYLRAISRKPKGKKDLPCVLLIPGYGCGSIENYSSSYNGRLIKEWVLNGYAVLTIEKSGMGDSYSCTPCAEADLAADIECYDAGYRFMQELDFTDRSRLFIWGHSLGGMIAPEIAKRHHPRGVMVFGTVFRPWSEFLPEMHRVQKPLLDGMNYTDTEKFTRLIHKVYYEFFILKKSRAELFNNPEYREIVAGELEHKDGSNNMWGRHWRFWQQIDSLNLAATWAGLDCDVLVLNGGTDYEQCAPVEPVLIEQTVNAAHPGKATRIQIEDLDHFMMKSATMKEAVKNFRSGAYMKGNFNSKISDEIISWMKETLNKS